MNTNKRAPILNDVPMKKLVPFFNNNGRRYSYTDGMNSKNDGRKQNPNYKNNIPSPQQIEKLKKKLLQTLETNYEINKKYGNMLYNNEISSPKHNPTEAEQKRSAAIYLLRKRTNNIINSSNSNNINSYRKESVDDYSYKNNNKEVQRQQALSVLMRRVSNVNTKRNDNLRVNNSGNNNTRKYSYDNHQYPTVNSNINNKLVDMQSPILYNQSYDYNPYYGSLSNYDMKNSASIITSSLSPSLNALKAYDMNNNISNVLSPVSAKSNFMNTSRKSINLGSVGVKNSNSRIFENNRLVSNDFYDINSCPSSPISNYTPNKSLFNNNNYTISTEELTQKIAENQLMIDYLKLCMAAGDTNEVDTSLFNNNMLNNANLASSYLNEINLNDFGIPSITSSSNHSSPRQSEDNSSYLNQSFRKYSLNDSNSASFPTPYVNSNKVMTSSPYLDNSKSNISPFLNENSKTNISPFLNENSKTNISPFLNENSKTNISPFLNENSKTNISPFLNENSKTNISPFLNENSKTNISPFLNENSKTNISPFLNENSKTNISPFLNENSKGNMSPFFSENNNGSSINSPKFNSTPSSSPYIGVGVSGMNMDKNQKAFKINQSNGYVNNIIGRGIPSPSPSITNNNNGNSRFMISNNSPNLYPNMNINELSPIAVFNDNISLDLQQSKGNSKSLPSSPSFVEPNIYQNQNVKVIPSVMEQQRPVFLNNKLMSSMYNNNSVQRSQSILPAYTSTANVSTTQVPSPNIGAISRPSKLILEDIVENNPFNPLAFEKQKYSPSLNSISDDFLKLSIGQNANNSKFQNFRNTSALLSSGIPKLSNLNSSDKSKGQEEIIKNFNENSSNSLNNTSVDNTSYQLFDNENVYDYINNSSDLTALKDFESSNAVQNQSIEQSPLINSIEDKNYNSYNIDLQMTSEAFSSNTNNTIYPLSIQHPILS